MLSERKTIEYLAKFKKCLKDKNLSPKAQAVAIACVRSFYKAFDIQLSSSIGKLRKAKALRENQHFLTREDILKLVTNAKSLRDKAIILCMASSGMARQEIINLRVKDIEFDENGIGTVSIRRQKSQTDYVTFISPEAGKAMKNYFDERNRSEQLKIKGENDFVFVTHDIGRRGKPSTFTFIFWQMAKQLGYSNGGFQSKSKSHGLRKYFAAILENSGFPKAKIDFMLGHAQSDNDLSYFNRDPDKLKELYIKFLPYLTFEKTIEVRSLDTEDAKRLEGLEKENKDLKKQIQDIKADMDKRKSADETLNKLFADKEFQNMIMKKMKELS